MECFCQRCHKTWDSRTPDPVQCPFCKSPRWTEPRKTKSELEERIKELERLLRESNAARVK